MPQQLREVIECIDVVELTGVDQLTGQGCDDRGSHLTGAKIRYSFPGEISQGDEGSPPGGSRLDHRPGRSPLATTILFIPLSAAQHNLASDWAEAAEEVILRQCPVCLQDSIVGHGRRRKQAHDEDHDWIGIRRGVCNLCGKTFTFLPLFSPPYTHYSLIARSQALRRYFLEGCSWETAAPPVRDPDRVADPSTLRRWFRSLDSSQPPFSFLRRTMQAIGRWLPGTEVLVHDSLRLCWQTVFPFLRRCWPLRI